MLPIPKTAISANLDLLRAVAVLCVFASHALSAFHLAAYGSLGRFGVLLFFVHTSLVLMESLQRLDVVATSRWRLTAAFWTRRIFRIYPLAVMFVLLVVVFRIPSAPDVAYSPMGIKGVLANIFLVQNLTKAGDVLGVLWSLPIEVQMYVLLPFVYLLLRKRIYASIVFWAASVPLAVLLPRLDERLAVAFFAPCFLSGVVAYDLRRGGKGGFAKLPSWMWPVGIGAAIMLFGPFDDLRLGQKYGRTWVLSLFVGVLYVLVREGRATRLFHWIAEYSYGIYLSHSVLLWIVVSPMAGFPLWVRIGVLAATSVGVPVLLYRYLERPLMLVGAHLSRRVLHPASG